MTEAAREAQRQRNRDWMRRRRARPDGKAFEFASNLKNNHGLDVESYARLVEAQNRRCAGCGRGLLLSEETHVDHDHVTGKIRGILCSNCNRALGVLGDSPETLRALVRYLREADRG